MQSESEFQVSLSSFVTALQVNFSSRTRAQPEDQLKRPVQDLVEAIWPGAVVTRTEAQVEDVKGRPDIAADVNGLLTGFIELKAPSLGADPTRFRDAHSRAQWQRFQHLPNIIYTDGSDWNLFRSGELVASIRADESVTLQGSNGFSAASAQRLRLLLQSFLQWEPFVPSNPRSLAELIAPLTRIVRDDVHAALQAPGSGIADIARDWRTILFPTADDAQFADAYAQTLTYALLLARFHGASDLDPEMAARALESGHGLLADALRVLADRRVRTEVGMGLELLERTIRAVDPGNLQSEGNDPWLYFYEDFLAAYDPQLRNNYGVYYTPPAVIGVQVRLVEQLLEEKLGKSLGFANDDVVVLDPAAGTGAYPLAIIQSALDRVTERYGSGLRTQFATQLAENIHAFEILVGPYAVAHLRMTQKIIEEGGALPSNGTKMFLTDTLESPTARDMEPHGFLYQRLSDEHERAREVKKNTRVLVCIGNPPYDRQQRDEEDLERGVELHGGWVRFGDPTEGDEQTTGILSDFIEPAVDAGRGTDLKNIYNLYVYFWRWALWKVFETAAEPGIVSFITAASYIKGPGFVGMREHMRRTFDELWIIDLEGDNLGARRTENVFNIQSPVAIAIGIRSGEPAPSTPARVLYSRLEGTREEKLAALNRITSFDDLTWRECSEDWQAPFLPSGTGEYFDWPKLTDIFPWQHSGVQFKRTWPIGETRPVLEKRWETFVEARGANRAELFRETRDRKVDRNYADVHSGSRLPPLIGLPSTAPVPVITRFAFRSLDRHWAIIDGRLADYLRPSLWRTHGPRQVYMTSLLTGVLGVGPAAMAASHPPDLHHFRGSFGGKDVIPLWRDSAGTVPNIARGLIDQLNDTLGIAASSEDLFSYVYGVLSAPSYTSRFMEELSTPGPRIPLTTSAELFQSISALGCRLIGWHTYGERMGQAASSGAARSTVPVPNTPIGYPEEFSYDAATCQLHVGDGIFAPVTPDIWGFEISGMSVVQSWLGYRMRRRSGRRSSDLDSIRPETWTAEMSLELLSLLWTLEATLSVTAELDALLEQVLDGPTIPTTALPQVDPLERQEPTGLASQASLF